MPKKHEAVMRSLRRLLQLKSPNAEQGKAAVLICFPEGWQEPLDASTWVIDLCRLVSGLWRQEEVFVLDADQTIGRLTVDFLAGKFGSLGERFLPVSSERYLMPKDANELDALMVEHQFGHLMLDFSLPSDASAEWVMDMLPPDVAAQAPRPTGILAGLLAWGASVPSVQSISALLPKAITVGSGADWLRTYASRHLAALNVLELPDDVYKPYPTSSATTLVHFADGRNSIHFDKVVSSAELRAMESTPWYSGVVDWLNGSSPISGFLCPSAAVTKWSVAPNSPALQSTEQRLSQLGKTVRLGDVCDIFIGVKASVTQESSKGDPFVKSSDILGGTLGLASVKRYELTAPIADKHWLLPGDILLPRYRGTVAVIYSGSIKAVASDTLLVVRARGTGIDPTYLCEFLTSPTGRLLLDAMSGNALLAPKLMASVRIPVLEPSLNSGLREITDVVGQIQAMAQKLKERSQALFESENEGVLRTKLGDLKRVGKVLTTAMLTMDELDYQISSLYPFPIAYGYRLLASGVQPHDLLVEQLRLAEAILAFLGSVSLSLLDKNEINTVSLNYKTLWQSGMSPGAWRDVIARCSKVLRTRKDDPLARAISSLDVGSSKKGLGAAMERLVTIRNNYFHNRGPSTPEDLIVATQHASSDIGECMRQLAFLTEFPIRLVSDINVNRGGEVTLSCIRYMGDHPGLTQEDIAHPRPLKKNDLYLEAKPGDWRPLYPFLSVNSCPHCKVREVYFIDAFRGDAARLKSFDRGHTLDSEEVAAELMRE